MSTSLTPDATGMTNQPWRVLIRTDASLEIGSGHVMRCLTLADALRTRGAHCQFVCREHPGNLIDLIRTHGFAVWGLPVSVEGGGCTLHADWLGASVSEDTEACLPLLRDWSPDWLLVDHYALDATWEAAVRPYCRKLMVIDDLADRNHLADLLLDQNLGRHELDYAGRLPGHCRLLVGCEFALLRPEFERWREVSLKRARTLPVAHLLINLGGVDKDNLTHQLLRLLPAAPLADDCRITVVMGRAAPWVESVRHQAAELPWSCEVLVDVQEMARLLASVDLVIGAAGSSTWERCALGLPSLLLVVADNQRQAALAMERVGIARVVWPSLSFETDLLRQLGTLLADARSRQALSSKAADLCDGFGVGRIIDVMHEVLS